MSADTRFMGDDDPIVAWEDKAFMVWSKYTANDTGVINKLKYGEGYIPHPANVKIGIYTASGTLLNSREYTVYADSINLLDFPSTGVIQGNDYYIGLKGDRSFLTGCTANQVAGKKAYWEPYMPYSISLIDFNPSEMWNNGCSMKITAWQATTNWPPTVILPYSTPVKTGDTYTASGSFTDSGSNSWTATVNYGDGSAPQPLELNGQNFTLNHIYTTAGAYTVTVSITDNNGAVGTRSAPVEVDNDLFLMGDQDPAATWEDTTSYMVWSKFTTTATGTINQLRYANGNNSTSTNVKIGIYSTSGTLLKSDEYVVHAGWNTLTFPDTQVIENTEYYIGLKADQGFAAACTTNPAASKHAYWEPYMPYSTPLVDFAPADMWNSTCSMAISAWQRIPTNQAPVLNPIGNKTVNEGQQLQFALTANDPDGNNLTYSAANLPPGAAFNTTTATFTWAPGFDQAGNYPDIEFTVTDNGSPMGLDTELVTITVGDVNRAPVIDQINPKDVLENHLLTFTVSATDPDGDAFTLSATNMPTGASFNAQTGVFSWIPALSQAGNYIVTFNATDNGTPVEIGHIDVPITVGNNPTPVEQADNLVNIVVEYNLPTNVENSYLSNLKKVGKFIDDGKINPAINQLNAFINKVNTDYAAGTITQAIRDNLVSLAQALLADLQ